MAICWHPLFVVREMVRRTSYHDLDFRLEIIVGRVTLEEEVHIADHGQLVEPVGVGVLCGAFRRHGRFIGQDDECKLCRWV